MKTIFAFAVLATVLTASNQTFARQPNVLLIMCDDLNDYVVGFGGHPQSTTPNIDRLSKTGVRFLQAHCNIPICGPSRASMFTGIYPHHSGCYGFERWDKYPVLQNSRTMMSHFRANGYRALGTGKLMHHVVRSEWTEYGNAADYGPFAFDGKERVAHPDVPSPFRDIGAIDGSFGPLVNLTDRTFNNGKSYRWQTGGWNKLRELRVVNDANRDMTADELNAKWAAEKLTELSGSTKPFFMGVGFIRPHTPLIVPKRYFDKFPLESIQLPKIKPGDVEDTHARSFQGNHNQMEPGSIRTLDMGTKLFTELVATFDSQEDALKRFIQAYLACVASVDEQIGVVLDALDNTGLAENTIVVLTSDHGWGMGEKDYLYKNSLWQESTRVPLVMRTPNLRNAGTTVEHPVSLVDLYPTFVEACDLKGATMKNEKGHELDGHSLLPLLKDPESKDWPEANEALTAMYKWAMHYDPAKQSYSLRGKNWRYIRYGHGKEELYHTSADPYEWDNIADDPKQTDRINDFRRRLASLLPEPGTIPPQPRFQPKKKNETKSKSPANADSWKEDYFAKHPEADTNQDGELSWPELKAYRVKNGELKK